MNERNISFSELHAVLETPDITYPGKYGETNSVKEVRPGRRIRVVTNDQDINRIVITALVISAG